VLADADVRPAATAGRDVELTRRSDDDRSYLFAINHGPTDAVVNVTGRDLVADTDVDGRLVLGPGAVAVVREQA
jgi:beta-galactosidase